MSLLVGRIYRLSVVCNQSCKCSKVYNLIGRINKIFKEFKAKSLHNFKVKWEAELNNMEEE